MALGHASAHLRLEVPGQVPGQLARSGHAARSQATRGARLATVNRVPELRIRGLERVTGIEPALSAWESVPSGPVRCPDLRDGLSASDRERPFVTGVNGPLMARGHGQFLLTGPARLDLMPPSCWAASSSSRSHAYQGGLRHALAGRMFPNDITE